jgi:hypothetical protein
VTRPAWQVLGHPGLAQAELVDELTHRTFARAQQVQKLAAMGVGQDLEGSSHAS